MQYYIRIRGKVFGPFDEKQLLDMKMKGKIGKTNEISENKIEWKSAELFDFLFPVTTSTASAQNSSPGSPSPFQTSGAENSQLHVPEPPEWFYSVNGTDGYGPVATSAIIQMLHQGTLQNDSYVWKQGQNAMRLDTVPTFGVLPSRPPVPNGEARSNNPVMIFGILLALVLGIGIIGIFVATGSRKNDEQASVSDTETTDSSETKATTSKKTDNVKDAANKPDVTDQVDPGKDVREKTDNEKKSEETKPEPEKTETKPTEAKEKIVLEEMPAKNSSAFLRNHGHKYSGTLAQTTYETYRTYAKTANRSCQKFVDNYDDNDIVTNITKLQEIYDTLMSLTLTEWNSAIEYSKIQPEFSETLAILNQELRDNKVFVNLDKCTNMIRDDVKKLDKKDKENTIKLYAVLAQYQGAITDVAGSYRTYSQSRLNYKDEFAKVLSLAKLEW